MKVLSSKKTTYSRVMYAGGLPAGMFGCECSLMPEKLTRQLRGYCARSLRLPISVPGEVLWQALPAGKDPKVLAYEAPLVRFAKEVWFSTSTVKGQRPDDIFLSRSWDKLFDWPTNSSINPDPMEG